LHGVFQLGVVLDQRDLQRGGPQRRVRSQQLLNDLHHGFVVENPLVPPARRQPEPWPQHQLILVAILADPRPLRLGDDAVVMAGTGPRNKPPAWFRLLLD